MKPEPPPYPRPVPSIDFDEDPILPGTVIYTNDKELDENERVAKRRRIEANANAYLRGESLFILSAGLRGPFNRGWRNPWATRSIKRKAEVASIGEEQPSSKRARLEQYAPKLAQHINKPGSFAHKLAAGLEEGNLFAKTIRSSEPPTHDEKVEQWLRRSSVLSPDSFVVPTSPTPKKKISAAGSTRVPKPAWTPTKQRIAVNSQDIRAPEPHIASRVVDSFDTIKRIDAQPTDTHEKLQTVLQAIRNASHMQAPRASRAAEHDIRAEDAILRLKKTEQSVQDVGLITSVRGVFEEGHAGIAANSTDERQYVQDVVMNVEQNIPSALDTSALETAHGNLALINDIGSQAEPKDLDVSIDEQPKHKHDREEDIAAVQLEEPHLKIADIQAQSTMISQLPSVKVPPSAQHKPELQASTSNISSGALLPDVPAEIKSMTALVSAPSNLSERTGGLASCSIVLPQGQIDRHTRQSSPRGDKAECASKEVIHPPKSTSSDPSRRGEAALNHVSKSPARDTTGKMSQTSLDGSIVRTPLANQSVKSAKKNKKTSFAAETSFNSSHGSIKSILKVQKADMSDRGYKGTPPALSFSKSIEPGTSLEEKAISLVANSPIEVLKAPTRSILKSSRSMHSSPAAARASVMLSPRHRESSSFSKVSHRGQLPSGQNGIVRDEQFDLEGAMDDLGSFLSTWDAEKESLHAM